MARCEVCFRHCDIQEGGRGFCYVRSCKNGKVMSTNYGRVTSIALDPIEKKPLSRFHPGSYILSVGSYGCNLRCPFCQNDEISWSDRARHFENEAEEWNPEEIAKAAEYYKKDGNIGVAFTYNEPLIGYEFVRDTAIEEIAPFIDAMNIDLKGFSESYYRDVLGGNLQMVKEFIEEAVKTCHVELTTLIVPGENDTEDEMRAISSYISNLKDKDGNIIGRDIPLHISRFFPRFKMTDRNATDIKVIYHLADIARESLNFVYEGNC